MSTTTKTPYQVIAELQEQLQQAQRELKISKRRENLLRVDRDGQRREKERYQQAHNNRAEEANQYKQEFRSVIKQLEAITQKTL